MDTKKLARLLLIGPLILAGVLVLGASQGTPPGLSDLERQFLAPPDDARIMMRWWWFGPTVTQAGLDREMRLMKEGGIGGFEIQPVYPVVLDDPSLGFTTHPFLSPAFLDHVRFAAGRARELGLRVDLTVGSGWPFGGPQVGITQAAGKLRIERVVVPPDSARAAVPDIRPGERLIAAFLAPSSPAAGADGLREVSDIKNGVVALPDRAPRAREVLFFVSSRSGMMVKRPAVGAEGFVLNHYDRAAVDHYLQSVGDRLLSAFGEAPPYAVFCDSLEVYESDWTDDFLEEFRARRGYDLRPRLPALVLDAGPATAALRHDWGQTLTELVNDRFFAPAQAWARRHGTKFRIQGYGIPPATISSNAGVDLPEGEGFRWKALTASRWASSIGHLYGRPVISSETWTWLHSPSFRATPLDVKAEADLHFLQGINQLIGHGWPYTADGVADPGWRFYAAGVFNDRNPWWIAMPDLARYLQRTSFLLRQGRPVNDVAVYLPNDDAWAAFVPGKVGSFIDALGRRIGPDLLPAILAAGFNPDFVDDGAIAGAARADQGAIVIGGNRYRALVLPDVERMPAATLRAVEGFAAQGVRVFATRRTPALSPGYLATASDHAAVRDAAERLFRGTSAAGTFVERDADLGQAMASKLEPDLLVSAAAGDIGFAHRALEGGDLYFVVNTSNQPVSFDARFRAAAGRADQWDPLSGRMTPIPLRRDSGRGGARGVGGLVALELAPYQSTVVVFRPGVAAPAARPASAGGPAPVPIDISAGWRVAIGPAATPMDWASLRSWTDDEATRYFSGVASYEKDVEVPAAFLRRGLAVRLDLGPAKPVEPGGPGARMQAWVDAPVRDAAIVHVNGRRAGSVWSPPYEIDVTGLLTTGPNRIRIEVANLAINHMAGRALPDYKLLNLRYGTRFEPQDMGNLQPLPAGLFGPIRLVSVPARPPAALAR